MAAKNFSNQINKWKNLRIYSKIDYFAWNYVSVKIMVEHCFDQFSKNSVFREPLWIRVERSTPCCYWMQFTEYDVLPSALTMFHWLYIFNQWNEIIFFVRIYASNESEKMIDWSWKWPILMQVEWKCNEKDDMSNMINRLETDFIFLIFEKWPFVKLVDIITTNCRTSYVLPSVSFILKIKEKIYQKILPIQLGVWKCLNLLMTSCTKNKKFRNLVRFSSRN